MAAAKEISVIRTGRHFHIQKNDIITALKAFLSGKRNFALFLNLESVS